MFDTSFFIKTIKKYGNVTRLHGRVIHKMDPLQEWQKFFHNDDNYDYIIASSIDALKQKYSAYASKSLTLHL